MGKHKKQKKEQEKISSNHKFLKIAALVAGLSIVSIGSGFCLFSGKQKQDLPAENTSYNITTEPRNHDLVTEKQSYDLIKEQIYSESDVYVLYVPDLHSEKYLQTNLQHIDRILKSDKIDIIGLEGLVGSVHPGTIEYYNQKRLNDYNFEQNLHRQLHGLPGKGQLVELYCYAFDKRVFPPGYMYAKELLSKGVYLFGFEDTQVKQQSDYFRAKSYAAYAYSKIKLLLRMGGTKPQHKKILSQMQKDILGRYGSSVENFQIKKREKQIRIDQRNQAGIDNFVSEMRTKNFKKGLLVYGVTHQSGLIEILESRKISYGILNNGITPALKNRFGGRK